MPQLLLLGLDPWGADAPAAVPAAAPAAAPASGPATPDATATIEGLSPATPLFAANPQHPLIQRESGGRARAAGEASIRELLAEGENAVYVAVGHPLLDDTQARALHRQATAAGWQVRVEAAQSLLEVAYTRLDLDGAPLAVLSGSASGVGLADAGLLVPAANLPPRELRELTRQYHANHDVHVLYRENGHSVRTQALPLRKALTLTPDILYIPPAAPLERLESPETLRWIMARLRAPDGCPWDQEQTLHTLKRHLLEETAEVLDAMDEEDMDALREELGDLLLQVYFQAQVAEEQGDFAFEDVVRAINEKLVRRHPHVFGDEAVGSAAQALANWEHIKRQEHAARGKERQSVLDRVPRSLSGLATAQAIGKAVAKVGFDWPDVQDVLVKLREEIDELVEADTPEHRSEEFGDVLFVLAQVAKWLEIDAEEALRGANGKFRRRFAYMEDVARRAGSDLSEYSAEKLDSLWEEAKLATSNPWSCPR